MTHLRLHTRLRDMRDAAIRRPQYRAVYAHTLTVAHMDGRLIADDHPSWARLFDAIREARAGDSEAIDKIEREALRLRE